MGGHIKFTKRIEASHGDGSENISKWYARASHLGTYIFGHFLII